MSATPVLNRRDQSLEARFHTVDLETLAFTDLARDEDVPSTHTHIQLKPE